MSEPWEWGADAIKATVGAVRAGRSLAPRTWPHDAAAAVALSFDSDHEKIPLRDGLISPGAELELTLRGLACDSSPMADDDPQEIEADGKLTGVVEIPVEWIRADAPYFPGDPARPFTPPRAIGQMRRDEFDQPDADGGLEGHQRIWFATHAEVARYLAAQAGLARAES